MRIALLLLLVGCQSADTSKIGAPDASDLDPLIDARSDSDGPTASQDAAVDARPDAPPDAFVPPDAPPECTGASCPDDGNPCTQNLCTDGHCAFPNQPDGLACTDVGGHSGSCRAGACCAGCWDGAACVTGTSIAECGSAGQLCKDCDDDKECTADTCLSVANACTHTNRTAGTPCSTGQCANGGVCTMNTTTCGGSGQTCCPGASCTQAGTTCNYATNICEYCGGEDQLCCLVPGPAYACNDPAHLDCVSQGQNSFCRCGGDGEACCNSVIAPCDVPGQCNQGTCFVP